MRHNYQASFDDGLTRIAPRVNRGTDGSVDGEFSGYEDYDSRQANGIEIRTPVLDLDEGLEYFDKILLYLAEKEAEGIFKTNDSCGLHVNLSEASMVKSHLKFCRFYAHLISHFPEHKVLAMFNRTRNDYCNPLFVSAAGQSKADYLHLMALATCSEFGRNKYHSVGLHSRPEDKPESDDACCECSDESKNAAHRRVEFRCLGNANYHRDYEKLHTAIDLILDSARHAFEATLSLPKEGPRLRAIVAAVKGESEEEYQRPTYIACEC